MNRYMLILFSFLVLMPQNVLAAEKYFRGYRFDASIIPQRYSEDRYDYNDPYGPQNVIRVSEGDEYSIVVRNPLPVRVAAAVTVDGLNTLDGKRTSAAEGQKWIIEPYSSITIGGWQTSDATMRKFVFTKEGASYAKWKGRRDRKDYTANLGIIGVAYFWNSAELNHVLYPRPEPYGCDRCLEKRKGDRNSADAAEAPATAGRAQKSEQAGTGMGRHEWNDVYHVNFFYDTGMYSSADALTIRYEFGAPYRAPQPFEDWEYRYPGNYAPQMP